MSVIGYRCDLPVPEPCPPLSLGLGAMRREFDICCADQISLSRISCPMTSWAGRNFVCVFFQLEIFVFLFSLLSSFGMVRPSR